MYFTTCLRPCASEGSRGVSPLYIYIYIYTEHSFLILLISNSLISNSRGKSVMKWVAIRATELILCEVKAM